MTQVAKTNDICECVSLRREVCKQFRTNTEKPKIIKKTITLLVGKRIF